MKKFRFHVKRGAVDTIEDVFERSQETAETLLRNKYGRDTTIEPLTTDATPYDLYCGKSYDGTKEVIAAAPSAAEARVVIGGGFYIMKLDEKVVPIREPSIPEKLYRFGHKQTGDLLLVRAPSLEAASTILDESSYDDRWQYEGCHYSNIASIRAQAEPKRLWQFTHEEDGKVVVVQATRLSVAQDLVGEAGWTHVRNAAGVLEVYPSTVGENLYLFYNEKRDMRVVSKGCTVSEASRGLPGKTYNWRLLDQSSVSMVVHSASERRMWHVRAPGERGYVVMAETKKGALEKCEGLVGQNASATEVQGAIELDSSVRKYCFINRSTEWAYSVAATSELEARDRIARAYGFYDEDLTLEWVHDVDVEAHHENVPF